eukprot:269300-Pelagomonas_calceolata.AAC.16
MLSVRTHAHEPGRAPHCHSSAPQLGVRQHSQLPGQAPIEAKNHRMPHKVNSPAPHLGMRAHGDRQCLPRLGFPQLLHSTRPCGGGQGWGHQAVMLGARYPSLPTWVQEG